LLGCALVAASLVGCDRPLSADECTQLLDHYTELLVKTQSPGVTEEQLARAQREARAKASASRDFAHCNIKVSRRQFACAMAAPTVDEVERCLL
jgi:hypothetical protein